MNRGSDQRGAGDLSRLSAGEVMRRCGRTFWVASLLLPPSVRRDMATLYAFCRVVDDIADEAGGGDARARLGAVERAVATGRASDPTTARFLALAERRGIAPDLPLELIRGVRADLGEVSVRSEGELLRYCYRVASTVGLMICDVLRVAPAGRPFAIDLGVAMQMTNIARDVREDALAGRVYLPASWIDHGSVRRAARGDRREAERTHRATLRLLDLAGRYYRSADEGMRYLPPSARLGILAASRNYEKIGHEVRRLGVGALRARARTGAARKTAGVAQAGAAFAGTLARGRLRASEHDDSLHEPLAPLLAGA